MDKRDVSINLAIADDNRFFVDNTVSLITTNYPDDISVTVTARTGKELLANIKAATTIPDICLLDVCMPEMNGYDTLKELKKAVPGIKVLAFSYYTNEYAVFRMLKRGAIGYLEKGCNVQTLYNAVMAVKEKGYYYSDDIPEELFEQLPHIDIPEITSQETKFLELCCSELSYDQIADKMNISVRTVHRYCEHLFEKLNVHTRMGLMLFALQTGLTSIENNEVHSVISMVAKPRY